jgi:hypothetical protein
VGADDRGMSRVSLATIGAVSAIVTVALFWPAWR